MAFVIASFRIRPRASIGRYQDNIGDIQLETDVRGVCKTVLQIIHQLVYIGTDLYQGVVFRLI